MSQQMGGYVIRKVGTNCCNNAISTVKLQQVINEMNSQGFQYIDSFIDLSYQCGFLCPQRSAILIFKK